MASIQVSSISALKTALGNNTYDEIIVTDGTYVVAPAGNLASNSLWIGGGAIAARTTPVTVRAQTPGGVTFSGGGSGSWLALIFVDGAHDQIWDGFRFGNGTPSSTGVIVFGAYDSPAPHHITLRRFTMLPTIGDSSTASNDNLIYFSHSQLPGPHHITIEDYDADMAGGVDSAITFFHSEFGLENAEDIIVRRANIRNHTGEGDPIQIWDETVNRVLFEDVTITNCARGIRYELGSNVTLRRVQTINTSGPGYFSGSGKNPVFEGCTFNGDEIVLTASGVIGTAGLAKGFSTAAAGKVGARGTAALAKGFSTAASGGATGGVAITGTAALPKGWSTAAAGQQGLSAITGTSNVTFGRTYSGAGKVSFAGAATASFGWATSATGKPNGVNGTASLAKTFTAAAVGSASAVTSFAASSFRFATSATGSQALTGTSAPAFSFSSEGVGVMVAPVQSAASAFGWSSESVGELGISGDAASEFEWSAEAVADVINAADAASEFGWSTEAVAEALAPQTGDAASSFVWSTEAAGEHALSQRAASAFTWATDAVGTSLVAVIGVTASAFAFSSGAGGTTTGVVDPVPPPRPGRGRGRKHWPWLPPDQA